MAANKEERDITGLDQATDRKEAEYDLVKALLEASEFKTDEEAVQEVEIKRGGKYLFTVHLHPINEPDATMARKKSTVYMPNPNGKKLPPIEKERNTAKFNSWLIYLATTEEDQEKIWGNRAIMEKFNLAQPYESIDCLLTLGEKQKLVELVMDLSGLSDDEEEINEEEYAKN
ncbi:MAG: hypothetical protein IIZ93_01160 [Acidaminococcaceae bacterium]|nr:hypothetical protein [Acidaminococcaceae bacterium]